MPPAPRLRGALLTLLLLLAPALQAQDTERRVPGEMIVRLAPDAHVADLTADAALAAEGLTAKRLLVPALNIWLVEFAEPATADAGGAARSTLDAVRRSAAVRVAQFNHEVALRSTAPDDSRFAEMWGLNNTGQNGGTPGADVDAPEAWGFVPGGTSAHGDRVAVAVVDDGFDLNHPDLRYWTNTAEISDNGVDDDANGYVDDVNGWNAYSSSGNVTSSFHGTHVAGTAGARGNNGSGVTGVNWDAEVVAIQGSSPFESTVIEAYGYALALRTRYDATGGAEGAFVVATNSSFGVDFADPEDYPIWCGFYEDLGAAGILSAGATANRGIDVDVSGDVPTACASDYMVAVTNTTRDDERNGGAAYGLTAIDLGAPGTAILSTVPGGGYGTSSGTSMATPHVAGAVALVVSGMSGARLQEYKDNPAAVILDVKRALLDGTDDIGLATVSGGRLNLRGSLLESFDDDAKSSVLAADTTLSDAVFEGEHLYVPEGVTLTVSGSLTLRADGGFPAFIIVRGTLQGDVVPELLDGSEIVVRPGGANLLGTAPPAQSASAASFAFGGALRAGPSADFPRAGPLTLSFWMEPVAVPAVLAELASAATRAFRLELVEDGDALRLRYSHLTAGGEVVEETWGDAAVTAGQPVHVALTRAAEGVLRLYLDGRPVGGVTDYDAAPVANGAEELVLGNALDGLSGFAGTMDEARLYTEPLGSAAIEDGIYETLEGEEIPESLVAYYRFDGDDLGDDASGSNDATAENVAQLPSPFPLGAESVFVEATGAAGVGEAGARIDADVTTLGDDATAALYVGVPSQEVIEDGRLPDGVVSRSAFVWGADSRGTAAADLVLSYGGVLAPTADDDALLLFRDSPTGAWSDVTETWTDSGSAFSRDDVTPAGEYALGYTMAVASEDGARAEAASLSAPFPNPARAAAALTLTLTDAADATVEVFDVLGRRVAVLVEGPLAAGTHTLRLDARALAPGAYVVRATAGGLAATRRVTVVR